MVSSKVPHKYDVGVGHTVIEGTAHSVCMVLNGHDVNWLGGVPNPGSPHATDTDAPPGQTEISDIFGDASTAPVFQFQVIDNPSQGGASNPSNTCTFESTSIAQDLGDESESPDEGGDLRAGEHRYSSELNYNYVVDYSWGDLAPPYVAQCETPPSRAWSTSSGTPDSVASGEESEAFLLSVDSPRTDFSSTDSGSSSSASNTGSSTGDYINDSSDSWLASTVVGRSTTPERGDRQTKFRHNAVGAIVPPKEKGSRAHGAQTEADASEQEFLKQFFSVPIIQARLEENAAGRHPGRPGQPGSINSLLRRWLAVRGSKLAAAKAADEAAPYFSSANFGGRLPLLGSAALLQLAHDANNPLVSVRVGTVILHHRALSFWLWESL
jgi:hypothetical protein